MRPSADSAPEPRGERAGSAEPEESGRSQRRAERRRAGWARASGANVRGAGSVRIQHPHAPASPPSFLLSLPGPPSRSARPAPPCPRDPAAGARRVLAACPSRSRGALSRLRDAEPSRGRWESTRSPEVSNSQVAGRVGAQALRSGQGVCRGGDSDLGCESLALACPPVLLPSLSVELAVGVRSHPGSSFPRAFEARFEGRAPPSLGLLAERG